MGSRDHSDHNMVGPNFRVTSMGHSDASGWIWDPGIGLWTHDCLRESNLEEGGLVMPFLGH